MTRAFAWMLALSLAGAGCSRREPSPEFTRASEKFNKLYAQQLDDAYLDPGMREVEALLEKVSPDSLDAAAALQLLTRIREGRAKFEVADKERTAAMAQARVPPTFTGASAGTPMPSVTPTAAARPSADAGASTPAVPTAGMSTRDFNRYFGDCFEPAGPVEVNGRGTRDSFSMADSARCREQLPTLVNSVVLADAQTVMGVVPKSALQRTPVDGGAPAPALPDAGG
jgi:hypothetical protein